MGPVFQWVQDVWVQCSIWCRMSGFSSSLGAGCLGVLHHVQDVGFRFSIGCKISGSSASSGAGCRGLVLHWVQDVGVQCCICMMSGSSSSLSAGCQGSSFSLNAGCMSPWFYVSCHSSLRKADRILGSSQTLPRPSTNQTLCCVITFDAVWPSTTL